MRAPPEPRGAVRIVAALRDIDLYNPVRFEFDPGKSPRCRGETRRQPHGRAAGLDQAFLLDQKSDDPQQFRSIGWCRGRLCSVIFEVRRDDQGEYYHLITAWGAT
jgi:hypothetical protein